MDGRKPMNLHDTMLQMGDQAVTAARQLATLGSRRKNIILEAMAESLEANRDRIKEANARDMAAGREAGLSDAMLDRLLLTDKRMDSMISGVRALIGLKDPVGQRISRWIRPNGLVIQKIRTPIGVIGIIFESRPNVTVDSAALCFKTSNAVILRGGKEALESNKALVDTLQAGGTRKGLPANAIQLITTTDYDAIRELVQLQGRVDLVIPRGGEKLIRAVTEQAHVPVIKHYKGVCYAFVDESADQAKALDIIENSKCSRPGVCNALEKVLVHEKIAAEFLPKLAARLTDKRVELRADEASRVIVPALAPAAPADWDEEYLDLVMTIGIVPTLEAAIAHINRHGSHHSDAILAEDTKAQDKFFAEVDSACVYANASTRFTDGGEFGMGAEIGISTDKLHARGPMALEELTTYKYTIHGTGQIRS